MNRNTALLLMIALVGGAGIGYWAHRMPPPAVTASAPSQAPAPAERRVLYWYDPMQPNQHFDKPGKSPYMDMQLVAKYSDENADSNAGVHIDAGAAQNLGIRIATVKRGTLARTLRAVGVVGYDDNDVAAVQARTAGYIAHLYVRAPLTTVHRGQALADVVAPEWTAAEQEYLALKQSPTVDRALQAAARERLRVLGIPEGEVAALERNGTAPSHITLSAPIDGVISELDARDGMAVTPGTPLFRLSGLTRVWVAAEVPEAQAAGAREGTSATVHVPAWPGRDFAGRVIAVLPSVSSTTRTLPVRIEVPNTDGALSPGMYADVELAPASERSAIAVPTEAIIHTGERNVVIVADGHAYRPVEVHTGAESGGNTEVQDGLAEGDRIVLSGQFLIDSEASLRGTLTRLGAPPAEATP